MDAAHGRPFPFRAVRTSRAVPVPALAAALILLLATAATPARSDPVLSEFLARNASGLLDSERHTVDWIEIHNPGPEPVDLTGWFLTDDPDRPDRWRFPAWSLPPGGYGLVRASGKDRILGAGELHTNFKLAADGGYLALVRPDARTVVSEFAPGYPPQAPDQSYGWTVVDGRTELRVFDPPTPGAPNGPGFLAVALPPSLQPPGGTFTNEFDLTLAASPATAEIRYTLDGSIPTPASTLYTGPVRLAGTRLVRARAFVPGLAPSPVVGAAYTRLGITGRSFSSDLPLVVVNSFGRTISDSARSPAYLEVHEPDVDGRARLSGSSTLASRASVEIRGSSSTGFEKKSYGLELQSESGLDQPASVLGLPADADWVLYAPYTDKSLVRDALAYALSNQIGRYAPRTRFVELFLNRGNSDLDTTDYLGVYLLVEKVKISPDRVVAERMEPDDLQLPAITGGYLLKRDRFDANDQVFTTGRGIELGIEDPKSTQIGPNQRAWIRTWLNQMEGALHGTQWRDPVSGYRRFLDPDSFADHLLLVESARNIDGYRLSTFWHKDRNGLLRMGPVWDYNLTYGNANYNDGWLTNGWYYPIVGDPGFTWLARLMQDPDFRQRLNDRWHEHRAGPFATARVLATFDALTRQVREAQARNFNRWRILGTYVWPNWYVAPTWNDELAWTRRWITNRLAWMDTQFVAPPRSSHPGGLVPDGATVTLTASRGSILFTLDGTDPRLPGGGVAPTALTYSQPLAIQSNARLVARSRFGTTWSAPLSLSFLVRPVELAITEILFRPPGGLAEHEFVELRNTGSTPVDLPGIRLRGAVQFVFPPTAGTLLPGEHVAVARDRAAFLARFGPRPRVFGDFSGSLPDDTGTLQLRGAFDEPILEIVYRADWYRATRDDGFSLTVLNDRAPAPDWNTAANWRQSLVAGGTPGRPNLLDRGAPRFLDATPQPGGVRLRFTADPGVGITLEASDTLEEGPWIPIRDLVPASTAPTEVLDPTLPVSNPGQPRFYRLVTPRR